MILAGINPYEPRNAHKVLHIITGLEDGGAEAVLYRLIMADRRHTHEVISLTDSGKYGTLLSNAGVAVHALGMPRGNVTMVGLKRLWQITRESKAGVVQTWMYHADVLGGLVARLAGKRAVVWGIRNASLDPRLITRTTRFVARVSAWLSTTIPKRIVSCSARAAELHVLRGYDGRKMVVIPNGYDVSLLAPNGDARASVRATLGIDADMVLLGMVARWDIQKDHANLIHALTRLGLNGGVTWRCLLVGSGMVQENAALRDLLVSSGLGDRVTLLGARSDIPDVMTALDLHLLSSASEGFPNVVAEAMACRTPCVVTDVGDAALIVGETGWVVPPQDSQQFACALASAIEAMSDQVAWQGRRRAARERIQAHFSLEQMLQAYGEVWYAAATS